MRLNRHGVVLVELLAALIITATICAALYRLVDRSQRFTRGLALMADERAQLAVAGFAVEGAVQGIDAGDGDLVAGSDSSVAILGPVGSALVCSLGAGGTTLDVASPSVASGATLTWWNTAPQGGDSLVVLDEGMAPGAADDRFVHVALNAVTTLRNACLNSPYLDSIADAGSVGWRLTPRSPLPATVTIGTNDSRSTDPEANGRWDGRNGTRQPAHGTSFSPSPVHSSPTPPPGARAGSPSSGRTRRDAHSPPLPTYPPASSTYHSALSPERSCTSTASPARSDAIPSPCAFHCATRHDSAHPSRHEGRAAHSSARRCTARRPRGDSPHFAARHRLAVGRTR